MIVVNENRPSILLVCSATILRAVLEEILNNAQYNVQAVRGLSGAIDRLERSKPDLLIIRPYLSNIDGHEAAVYLRTKNPGMRVLIVSGHPDDDRILRRAQLESFSLFPKAFTSAELIEAVEKALALPA